MIIDSDERFDSRPLPSIIQNIQIRVSAGRQGCELVDVNVVDLWTGPNISRRELLFVKYRQVVIQGAGSYHLCF